MAEWRERGYVPDSDEEDEEGFDGPHGGVGTRDEVPSLRQSSQAAVRVTRERRNHLEAATHENQGGPESANREGREGLEAVARESRGGVEAARSPQYEKPWSMLATDDPERLTKADTPPSLQESGVPETRKSQNGLEAAPPRHHRVLFSDETDGSAKANKSPFLKKHEPLLPLLASDREEGESVHDVDHIEVDDPLPSSPVAKELQATLKLGLRQVGEVLQNPERKHGGIRNGSQSSSPLSSLGSLDYELGKDDRVEGPPAKSPQIQPIEPLTRPSPQPSAELLAPQRALRQRTQIQLHPYALEDARYQQELKARGLKPVRIAASQGQQTRRLLQSAGDEASLFSSSPLDEDSAPMSAAGGMQDNISFDARPAQDEELSHPNPPLRIGDDDEDLPDLASIFRDRSTGPRPVKSKRFYAAHTGRPGLDERGKDVDMFDLPEDEEITYKKSSEPATFFVPPSPPRSGTTSASDRINDTPSKEQLLNSTPGRLPAPLLSSETHSRKRPAVELFDSSLDLSDDGAGDDSASSSEEDDEKVGRIKAMKRRMKGVLPASWLKLDLKQQTVKEGYHRYLQPANELVGGKGLAKPVPAPRPQTGVAVPSSTSRRDALQFDFSDEDPSSDDGIDVDRAEYGNTDTSVLDYRSRDVLEDDRIDTMQPTRERRPNSASKERRKRQQRISDTWQNVREQSDQQDTFGRSHSTSKKRLHKASTAKRQRKHKSAPRLTVLDAPGFVQLSTLDQPRFLKVASRRAQQETRKATQDPLGKFLRLATHRDTGDINQNLRHWQDGHIRPHHIHQAIASKIGPAADRGSLPPERTGTLDTSHLEHPHWTTSSTASALSTLKISTDSTFQRILFKQQGLSVRSSREAASIASNSHVPASLARLRLGINLRKPLQNRAGLGSLQTTATHPRFAQLEHTVSDRPSANLSLPLASSSGTNDQIMNQASTFQPTTSVTELDDQLATASLEPAQQPSGIPIVHRIRKGKAPQRTQSVIMTEAHRPSSTAGLTAGLPITQGSDRISDEANTVTDLMTMLSRDGGRFVNDGWSILWPPLQKWLEVYSDKPSTRTPSEKKQAREMFKLCHELVLKHGWPTAWDDLIRKAAWFFSAFDMVDPFDSQVNPHVGLPPFLNEMSSTVSLALPEAGDSTFYVFLDMLAKSLTQKSAEVTNTIEGPATDKRKKAELQSFVNRLYPNNGRLLSEHEAIRKIHLASLWNRCSLYLTLYCFTTEDCRPRLSHFRNLVDFKKSHIKACEAILAVWGVLACFHAKSTEASQYDRLAEIGDWMQFMILAMVLKWVEARQEVENELQTRFITERHAMQILHTNQRSVEAFLQGALATWAMALEKCGSQSTAVQLLNIGQLDIVLENLTRFFDNNDTMFQHTLGVIDQYLHKYGTADLTRGSSAHRVVLFIFHTIDKTLSRRLDSEPNYQERGLERIVNRRLTYDWSLVASALITAKERSWDDFLEPAGRCSWERFKDTKRSAQYQTLFISHIINAKEDVYRDNKFWYLSYWLRALLRPSHEFVFEHELSNAVLKADQYEPILMNLPFLLQSGSDGYETTLADLKHNRTNVLGRIIEGIATASTTYDSQTVDPYALQPPEMADLLRVMMNTMRLTRSSLEHGSKERGEYELVVCKLAEKMERHTNNIVPLERWLTDADAIAFSLYNLRKRFGGPAPTTGTIIVPKQEIFWFQHTCQKAAVQGTPDQISEALRNVYVDASDVSEIEWYQPKMLAMMEQVFPAYLELALTDKGALMAAPLLRSLDSICHNIFMRALSMGSEDHSQLLDALYSIIISARIAMQRSNVDRDVASIMTFERNTREDLSFLVPEPGRTRVLAFASVVRIARIAIRQFREVVRYAGLPKAELERIAPHTRYIFVFVCALYSCRQDGQEGHWSELSEASWHHLANEEANKVKKFTAEVLEGHLRLDWACDAGGTWWVTQGRSAVSVKREETATKGLMDWGLRTAVKDEMLDYMDMFRGGSRRTVVGVGYDPWFAGLREFPAAEEGAAA